jgi:Zn-dependent M28 family amino/carboxypeptidase
MRKALHPLLLSVVVVLAMVDAGANRADSEGLALGEIQARRVEAHLKFLSHDLLEGRAPATRGGDLAAEYIAAQFRALGLEPAGDSGTFMQQVPIVESRVEGPVELVVSGNAGSPAGGTRRFEHPIDIVVSSGRQQERIEAHGEVVFVGYGIVAPEYDWNDYEGVDVTDRIVLVMVNDPDPTPEEPELFGGEALTYYGRWTYKYEEAARQGALGAIIIHTTPSATYGWQVVQSSWGGTQFSLPAVEGEPSLALEAWVTEEAARSIASLGGHDLDALRRAAASRNSRATPLGVTASTAFGQEIQKKTSPNVIGRVPGARGGEAVIYTAHYDHLGMREENGERIIYNGAIDNASGVAGMIAIAKSFQRGAERPGRSVYVVATTAEESGLLGSEFLAANPPVPIERVAAVINVDGLNLLGTTQDIVLLGAERSTLGPKAERLAEEQGRVTGPDPSPGHGYFFRSDHFPLAKRGVPAVSIGSPTGYIGKDAQFAARARAEYLEHRYHQPADEFDPTWDYSGAVEDLRLLAALGWRVAASPELPRYYPSDPFARARSHSEPKMELP